MEFSSIQGIRYNLNLFDQYARDLQNFEEADVPGDLVGMMVSEAGVRANVTALKTAHEMSHYLIDILA